MTENDDLQNQIDALKASLSIAQSRTITTTALRDSVNEMNSRSSSMSPWHLYLLKTRLDLTPEQEANFQAAASGGDAGREIGQKLESLLTPGSC